MTPPSAKTTHWPGIARAGGATLLAGACPLLGVTALARYGTDISLWLDITPAPLIAVVLLVCGAMLCGLALLPTHAVALAAGWAMGVLAGPTLAWLAVMLAALMSYEIGGRLAGPGIRAAMNRPNRPRLAALHRALVAARDTPGLSRTAALVALVRVSPLAPFAATNVALAAVGVARLPFLVGSGLGLLPRIVIVAALGAGMAELNWSSPRTPWLLAAGILAAILALALVGWVAQRALRNITPTSVPQPEPQTARNAPPRIASPEA